MSHFTVLVIGENVEDQLARYEEDTSNLPKEWLTFEDEENDLLKAWDSESVERIRLEDGSLTVPWDERFKVGDNIWNQKTVIPAYLEKVQVPYKDLFASFEEFVADYHERERDPEMGRFGYWKNEKAKWDWFQIGGRWSGYFTLKDGSVADQTTKGEVDFERMREDHVKEKLAEFRLFHEVVAGRTVPKWETVAKLEGEAFNLARIGYHNHPVILDIRKHDEFVFVQLEQYQVDEATFIDNARNNAISTFAFVKDGEWQEKGQMGWWACVSNEKDPQAWSREFNKMLDSLPDDTQLTLVDAHI